MGKFEKGNCSLMTKRAITRTVMCRKGTCSQKAFRRAVMRGPYAANATLRSEKWRIAKKANDNANEAHILPTPAIPPK
jgi:hypothetical protein